MKEDWEVIIGMKIHTSTDGNLNMKTVEEKFRTVIEKNTFCFLTHNGQKLM